MTFGAGAWRGDHVAAMMTGKAARQAMLHHPGGTIGALKTITAMPAKRERRITPPIEEQERLFALFQNLIHCPDQLRRYPAAALGRIAGEIDGLDLRQFRASIAGGQLDFPIAANFPLLPCFDGRSEERRVGKEWVSTGR